MRETLKKYSPKPENINLGWFNKHLTNPEIWKWNKKTISRAFAIGLFFAFIPLPMHTLLVAIFAVFFSANILLSVLVVWINNPIEMDPEFEFTFSYIMQNFGNATLAFWVGGLITSTITAVAGYYSIIAIYKYKAFKRVRRWK